MNLSYESVISSILTMHFQRCVRFAVFLLVGMQFFVSPASAQSNFAIASSNEISDEQVFHLIATYELDSSSSKTAIWVLLNVKSSTLQRRIESLSGLRDKWSKLANQAEETAEVKRREIEAVEDQANAAESGILVFSSAEAGALYLACQSERQRITWEIAAEEATLEQLKKFAEQPQAPASEAVLEGKIRVAEIALQAAKDILDNNLALKEKNVIAIGDLRTSEHQYQTRVAELDIAKAEMKAQRDQGQSTITDGLVKSTLNLAQLRARDEVLTIQIQRLAKAKHQIIAVEKLRADAATQISRAHRYRDMAIDQQAEIDRLEALNEALQVVLQPKTETPSKGSESEKLSPESTKDNK